MDDEPVTFAGFFNALASESGAPRPRRVPAWLARWLAGNYVVKFLTTSMATSNRHFKEATGWRPRYATYSEGLRQIVQGWQAAGFMAV